MSANFFYFDDWVGSDFHACLNNGIGAFESQRNGLIMKTLFTKKIIILAMAVMAGFQSAGATEYSEKQMEVVLLFQGNEEPTAEDAIQATSDILKVGVFNDGSRRDGYASYVCQVLYERGFKGLQVWVQVIDIIQLTRNNKWVRLGQARCQQLNVETRLKKIRVRLDLEVVSSSDGNKN